MKYAHRGRPKKGEEPTELEYVNPDWSYEGVEKTCPVCGKTYRDTSLNGSKVACCEAHRAKLWNAADEQRALALAVRFRAYLISRAEVLSAHDQTGLTNGDGPDANPDHPAYERHPSMDDLSTEATERLMRELEIGRCAICGEQLPSRKLHLDHNHKTMQIRSVLCSTCNHLLGFARDNTDRLKNAVRYLEQWEASTEPSWEWQKEKSE